MTLSDPHGLLSPYVVKAKILLQGMWAKRADWDEMVDEMLLRKANQSFAELARAGKSWQELARAGKS